MRKVITITLLLFAGSFIICLSAQENIKALVKKCENMSSVDMSYIINKDPETKKVQNSITTITIKNDQNLIKDFIAAFEKDKDNAYSISGSVKNGVSLPANYKFFVGKDSYISCTMSISDDKASASVSYRESPSRPNNVSVFLNGELFDGATWDMKQEFDNAPRVIRERTSSFQLNSNQGNNKPELNDCQIEIENFHNNVSSIGVRVEKKEPDPSQMPSI